VSVRLVQWGKGDFPLLVRLLGDPAMTEHLGGPEDEAALHTRQRRYVEAKDRAFKIVDAETGADVGWVGYWDREVDGEPAYETGWAIVPEHQGRGLAGEATAAAIALMRAQPDHPRYVYAWPGVENGPSNGICRKLGFELVREVELDYPPGSGKLARWNEWRLAL
jgi:RimJ/RimL family protein N-acetyltransferase